MTRGICADNAEMDIWVDMMTVAWVSAAVRCMASADEDNDKNWEQEVSSLLDVKSRESDSGVSLILRAPKAVREYSNARLLIFLNMVICHLCATSMILQ